MGHKKKARTGKTQSVYAGFKRICRACKDNPLGALVIALGSIVVMGILNSFLGNFYDSCSKAMGNASVGFWRKSVDFFYITSAKTELTDTIVTIYFIIYWVMLCMLWTAKSAWKQSIEKRQSTLRELDDMDEEIATEEKASAIDSTDKLFEKWRENQTRALRRRTRNLRKEISKDLEKESSINLGVNLGCFFLTIIIVLQLLIDLVSYNNLKTYRHRITAVRPFMTSFENQVLERQWVLMRSKEDYQKIMETLRSYEQRADSKQESLPGKSGDDDLSFPQEDHDQ